MNLALYHRALSGETLLIDLSKRSRWKLTGSDRTRYLNGQVTNDVTKLSEDHVLYASVCTAKGRLEGDLFATRHGDAFYLDADPALRESLGARLDKYLIADDAQFEDITETGSLVHVLGSMEPAALPDGFVISHPRFGLPGFDVWSTSVVSPVNGEKLDDETIELLRIEHGLPRWGAELTDHTLPPEGGPAMERGISYTKGCYVGQEIIARLKSVGQTPRTLVFLKSESEMVPKLGAELRAGDKAAGTVTSAVFSPRLEKGIALAYVPRALAVEGTELSCDGIKLVVAQPLAAEIKA